MVVSVAVGRLARWEWPRLGTKEEKTWGSDMICGDKGHRELFWVTFQTESRTKCTEPFPV